MRCDAWADRDWKAAQMREERAKLRRLATAAEAALTTLDRLVDEDEKAEALKWLIAAATKKLEG